MLTRNKDQPIDTDPPNRPIDEIAKASRLLNDGKALTAFLKADINYIIRQLQILLKRIGRGNSTTGRERKAYSQNFQKNANWSRATTTISLC